MTWKFKNPGCQEVEQVVSTKGLPSKRSAIRMGFKFSSRLSNRIACSPTLRSAYPVNVKKTD